MLCAKNSTLAALAAASLLTAGATHAVVPSCNFVDVLEIPEVNTTQGELAAGFILQWANVELGPVANWAPIKGRLYIDGELFVNPNPNYGVGVEGIWFNSVLIPGQVGISSMPIPAAVGTHTVALEVDNENGTGTCQTTVTVRHDKSNPSITIGNYDVEQMGDGTAEVWFPLDIRDYSGDLLSATLIASKKPFGATLPQLTVQAYRDGLSGDLFNNKLTFTKPGDYIVQVFAVDAWGEHHISRNIAFTVDAVVPCFMATNQQHLMAGRAYPIGATYYAIGTNHNLGTAYQVTGLKNMTPGFWYSVTNCN